MDGLEPRVPPGGIICIFIEVGYNICGSFLLSAPPYWDIYYNLLHDGDECSFYWGLLHMYLCHYDEYVHMRRLLQMFLCYWWWHLHLWDIYLVFHHHFYLGMMIYDDILPHGDLLTHSSSHFMEWPSLQGHTWIELVILAHILRIFSSIPHVGHF